MPEARCSDYRLSASALQKWLRNEFSDDTITVEVRHATYAKSGFYMGLSQLIVIYKKSVSGHYLFNLPDGSQLTTVCDLSNYTGAANQPRCRAI